MKEQLLIIIVSLTIFIIGCGASVNNTQILSNEAKSIIGNDGAPMVLIPAGEFIMGSNNSNDEKPVHTVYLDAFYIDKYEVTNAQYKKFMDAMGHKAPYYWNDPNYNALNQPVVCVNWEDAKAYANWAGKRLPTEAEWEKAARGTLIKKKYPWGKYLTHDNANYHGTGRKDIWDKPSPVGSFSPNKYGLFDMAGNVYEWCADRYDWEYYSKSPRSNPVANSGSAYVFRGGSWSDSIESALSVSDRNCFGQEHYTNSPGFRCAMDAK